MLTHDVFFADSNMDAIMKVDYQGNTRQVIRRNLPNPVGVAVHLGDIYWVDRNLRSVFRASKLAGNTTEPQSLKSGLETLRDISIFDANNQPTGKTPCTSAGCEQLCFALPESDGRGTALAGGSRCACATGTLAADRRHCSQSQDYLIFTTRTEIHSVHMDPRVTSLPFEPVVSRAAAGPGRALSPLPLVVQRLVAHKQLFYKFKLVFFSERHDNCQYFGRYST